MLWLPPVVSNCLWTWTSSESSRACAPQEDLGGRTDARAPTDSTGYLGSEGELKSMIAKFIQGIPYARHKRRGDIEAPKRWTDAVKRETEELPKVVNACLLKLTFCLPPDKFPADLPYGPDLDNLTKRTLDALECTVFKDARGHDSCVVALIAMKTKVSGPHEAGLHLEILPVTV